MTTIPFKARTMVEFETDGGVRHPAGTRVLAVKALPLDAPEPEAYVVEVAVPDESLGEKGPHIAELPTRDLVVVRPQDGFRVIPGSFNSRSSLAWEFGELHGLGRPLLFKDFQHASAVHAALDADTPAARKWNARHAIASAEGVDNPWSGNAVWLSVEEMKEILGGSIPDALVRRLGLALLERDSEYEALIGRPPKDAHEGSTIAAEGQRLPNGSDQ